MSLTIKELEDLLDKKLAPINEKLKTLGPIDEKVNEISKDLNEIRVHMGYGNLKVIRSGREEM